MELLLFLNIQSLLTLVIPVTWQGFSGVKAKAQQCWKLCVCRGHVSIAPGTAPIGSEGKRGTGAL